jgi:heptosyltransferase-1
MKKFLIVKTSSLGDIIHVFPAIGNLKQKFPDSQIDWVVEEPFADVVESHPNINHVYRVSTKQWRYGRNLKSFWEFRKSLKSEFYDVLFDFQGNTKSGLLTFLAKAKYKMGFGRKSVSEWPNLFFTNWKTNPPLGYNIRHDYLYLVQSFLKNQDSQYEDKGVLLKINEKQKEQIQGILSKFNLERHWIMVCPGSAWQNKRMSTQGLITCLQSLNQHYNCSFLFIWGTEEEKQISEKLHQQFNDCSHLVEKLPIPVLQNLMNNMDLVIAMDSLPLHLAGTTRVSSFGIFGASSAKKYQPLGLNHSSYQGACPYKMVFENRCPYLRTCKTGACIRSLDEINLLNLYYNINNLLKNKS